MALWDSLKSEVDFRISCHKSEVHTITKSKRISLSYKDEFAAHSIYELNIRLRRIYRDNGDCGKVTFYLSGISQKYTEYYENYRKEGELKSIRHNPTYFTVNFDSKAEILKKFPELEEIIEQGLSEVGSQRIVEAQLHLENGMKDLLKFENDVLTLRDEVLESISDRDRYLIEDEIIALLSELEDAYRELEIELQTLVESQAYTENQAYIENEAGKEK